MAEIRRSRAIAAEPAQTWSLLADFGSLSRWADGVDHSCLLNHGGATAPLGTSRRVQIGRNTLIETIVEFDPPHALSYQIAGLPRNVTAASRWSLQPSATAGTIVTLTSTVNVASGPARVIVERLLARLMATRTEALLGSLATALEGVTV